MNSQDVVIPQDTTGLPHRFSANRTEDMTNETDWRSNHKRDFGDDQS